MVWFTGGPAADAPAADAPAADSPAALIAAGRAPRVDAAELASSLSCDACTLAAAALPLINDAVLGVVSRLPVDRHPAVLARDVTTLDVLSAGRAAIALCWSGHVPLGATRDRSAVCMYLGEAVAVCRAVLRDEYPVFEGRYLRITGAVNQPPPCRPGGPPLLVEVPRGITELVGRDPGMSFLVRQVVAGATAIICSDDPREIAVWRAQVADAVGARTEPTSCGQPPRIVCRMHLKEEMPCADPTGRTGRANSTHRAGSMDLVDRTALRARVGAARAAGADGLVVRLPLGSQQRSQHVSDPAGLADLVDAARVSERLASYFDLWGAEGR